MNNSWMKARRTKFAAYTTLYVVIVLAVVGGINFLANRYNKSYDTTSNKQFTLSDQTAKIAHNLKNTLTITYWDKSTNFTAAHDLLDRYRNLSPKIDIQYMDPDKKMTQAKEAGVKNYGTIFVDIANKHEEAKALTEEDITGAMVRALKNGDKAACFVLGSGEHSLGSSDPDGYSNVKDLLEKNNYKTQTLTLIAKPQIPGTCTILVVAGPTHDYIQPEVDAIKNYLEGGGRALFMLDPPLKFAKQQIDDNQALTNLLASWGVTADKDLVLDTSGVGQLFGLGPEFPLVTGYESHAIVRDMKDTPTGFPIARSLDVQNQGKSTVEKLFETGDNSFATSNLSSNEVKETKNDRHGPMVLGAAGTYNSGKENGSGRFVVV
ncbi:MAG: GldG family protein, partial [Bryobacteraceae bacterium]